MATQSQAVPTAPTTKTTTKSGIDLATFEDVLLAKEIPLVPPVTSVQQALSLLNNDTSKLLAIIQDGLQDIEVEKARETTDGWMQTDDNGKSTNVPFTGQLANPTDVNPVVLQFAKLMFDYDEAPDADAKRKAKEMARAEIKKMPQILASLQKKAAKAGMTS
jgi:hypothetical protein